MAQLSLASKVRAPSGYAASRIVVIGASLGGIQALIYLLALLPGDFPAAIVVVLHIPARGPSLLASIFSTYTGYSAQQVTGGEHLREGHVYIAPPNRHVLVNADGTLSLSDAPKEMYSRPSINVLFESAATSYGRCVTAVVLTGANSDGARGVQVIKRYGGRVLVQDRDNAQCFVMPQASIDTGCVDCVLALKEIALALMEENKTVSGAGA